MSSVPQYYLTLFNSVSEAIESMESQNYGTAKRIQIGRASCRERV